MCVFLLKRSALDDNVEIRNLDQIYSIWRADAVQNIDFWELIYFDMNEFYEIIFQPALVNLLWFISPRKWNSPPSNLLFICNLDFDYFTSIMIHHNYSISPQPLPESPSVYYSRYQDTIDIIKCMQFWKVNNVLTKLYDYGSVSPNEPQKRNETFALASRLVQWF